MKRGWNSKCLGDLLEIQNGYAFESSGFNPTKGLPLIRIRSLKAGTETETRFDGEYDKKYVVKAGDLLVGMDGEFGCYEWKGEPALLNQRVCRLQGFSRELLARFLFYGVNEHLKAIEDVTGYATVKHLSSKQILGIRFPVPPLDEQRRIVAILDEAFESISKAKENAEKNLQNEQELVDSYLYSFYSKRGKKWPLKRLGDIAEVQSGGTPLVSKKDYWNGDISWYSSGELNEMHTSASERYITNLGLRCSSAKLFPKGSLLIGMYDTAALKMSILDREGAFNQAIAGVKPNESIEVEFILHAINANKPRLLLERRGVRQKNLSLTKIKEILIPCPSPNEQRGAVCHLRTLLDRAHLLRAGYVEKLNALDELKSSILHRGFTGSV
jgi:type I restriction enzyme, S subunit